MATAVKTRVERRAARRAGEAGSRTEYLAFGLAGESFAVEVAHLAEILKPPPITEVPRAPRTILGVISVRGKLVTVLDLRRRFRLPDASIDRRTRILLADVGTGEQVGLLVDEVQQVWRLAGDEIESPQALGGEQSAHIAGIGRPADAGGLTFVLLDLRPIVESP
ncbi:MAG TPA: chemotaxis protein CheW [Polyangiaceae bacterium]|nr:chemotaxis protein CheW [Polyangiaceae bacterium]